MDFPYLGQSFTEITNHMKTLIKQLINFRKNAAKLEQIGEIVNYLQPLGKFNEIQKILKEN